MIENDDKDYVFLDYSKSFEKEFVISGLKQLIGNYTIFSELKEKEVLKEIKMVIFLFNKYIKILKKRH